MKKLLKGIKYDLIQGSLVNVKEIIIDSKNVSKDSLFVCLNGSNFDGHNFILDAYNNGCKNFLIEKEVNLSVLSGANVFMVDNTRKILSLIAKNFYKNPAKDLITIGITGTKGKTTTAQMIKNILEANGSKCGLIGTLGVFIGDKHYKTLNTTPESLDIQAYLREMVNEKCKYVVMEVSSQALKHNRVYGINFDYGIFTNLGRDHIGENEHKDYEEYRFYKTTLFKNCKNGLLNIDDDEFIYINKNKTCKVITFGSGINANYKIDNYSYLQEFGKIGMNFSVNTKKFRIYIPGLFSVYNACCAIALTSELGINYQTIYEALKDFKVKGRLEPVNVSDNFTVLIDYAHEAMSLKSLLTTIKQYNPNRIVTLFGCGGNRSKIRRYEMGEIAGKYSDLTILTEDNSRYEDVLEIIEDIKIGIKKTNGNYVLIPNRKDAIKFAIENALDGDIILICGKGHEDYQEIKGVRYYMDEREIITEILSELNKGFD